MTGNPAERGLQQFEDAMAKLLAYIFDKKASKLTITPHGHVLGGYRPSKLTGTEPLHRNTYSVPKVTTAIDLSGYENPIRDQGQTGMCTGFGYAYTVEMLCNIADDPQAGIRLSPNFLYYLTTLAEGDAGQIEAGTEPVDDNTTLQTYGICPESDDPFTTTEYAGQGSVPAPSAQAMADALGYKIGTATRLLDFNDVLNALSLKQGVVAGIQVYLKSFEEAPNGVVTLPVQGDTLEGQHLIHLDQADPVAGTVGFPNEWGAGWGNQGRGTLPEAFINSPTLTIEMWAFQLAVAPAPAPTPTPTPTPTPAATDTEFPGPESTTLNADIVAAGETPLPGPSTYETGTDGSQTEQNAGVDAEGALHNWEAASPDGQNYVVAHN